MFVSMLDVCNEIERILLQFIQMQLPSKPRTSLTDVEHITDFEHITEQTNGVLHCAQAGGTAVHAMPTDIADFEFIPQPYDDTNRFVKDIVAFLRKAKEETSTTDKIYELLVNLNAQLISSAKNAYFPEIIDCKAQILAWLEAKLTQQPPTSLPYGKAKLKIIKPHSGKMFRAAQHDNGFDRRMALLMSKMKSIIPNFIIKFPTGLVSIPDSDIELRPAEPDESLVTHCYKNNLALIRGPAVNALLLNSARTKVTRHAYIHATDSDIKQTVPQQIRYKDENKRLIDARKVRHILTHYDQNPCLHAWQLLLAALQRQYLYVYETQDASGERPMFFIDVQPIPLKLHPRLKLEYVVDVMRAYSFKEGIVKNLTSGPLAAEGVLARCTISCNIDLNTKIVSQPTCYLETESPYLHVIFQTVAGHLLDLSARKQALRERVKGQMTQTIISIFPLSIPLGLNTLNLHQDLNLTRNKLLRGVKKDPEWQKESAKQAEKDYHRSILAVAGKGIEVKKDEPPLDTRGAMELITQRFSHEDSSPQAGSPPLWSDEHQTTLELLIPQGFGNPGETIWMIFYDILKKSADLTLSLSTGANGTDSRSHLQKLDTTGYTSLTVGYRVRTILDDSTSEVYALKEGQYLDFTMTVHLPQHADSQFVYPQPANIVFYPGCEPVIERIIEALEILSKCTTEQLLSHYKSELLEKYYPTAKSHCVPTPTKS